MEQAATDGGVEQQSAMEQQPAVGQQLAVEQASAVMVWGGNGATGQQCMAQWGSNGAMEQTSAVMQQQQAEPFALPCDLPTSHTLGLAHSQVVATVGWQVC